MAAKKEWTRNRGKQPVGDYVRLEVRFRDGTFHEGEASSFQWEIDGRAHHAGWCDIMAWRRVRAPRKPAAIAPDHAPRPAVPEAKPAPSIVALSPKELKTFDELLADFVAAHAAGGQYDAPRRPRHIRIVVALTVVALVTAAVCYVF